MNESKDSTRPEFVIEIQYMELINENDFRYHSYANLAEEIIIFNVERIVSHKTAR